MIEKKLYLILRDLLRTKAYVEFYIGRNGDFDMLAATVVKETQKAMGNENSAMILVLPYNEKNMEHYEKYYDSIIIPECVEGIHPKGAITKRNRWMIGECDLLICYIERESGGAYTAFKYAKKLGKKIINLADIEDRRDN